MEALISTVVGVSIALAILIALFTGANLGIDRLPHRLAARVRPWVFVLPALAFLGIGLVVPAVRTVVLSFSGGRRGEDGFTLDTWTRQLTSDRVVSFDNLGDVFTSRLFLAAVGLGLVGLVLGVRSARRSGGRGADLSEPAPSISLWVAGFLILMAVFSTLRGVLWNNLWWVLVVVGLSTAIGLMPYCAALVRSIVSAQSTPGGGRPSVMSMTPSTSPIRAATVRAVSSRPVGWTEDSRT